jgi:hypothetical protein
MNFNDLFTSVAKELNDANVKACSIRSANHSSEYFRQKKSCQSVGQEAYRTTNAMGILGSLDPAANASFSDCLASATKKRLLSDAKFNAQSSG